METEPKHFLYPVSFEDFQDCQLRQSEQMRSSYNLHEFSKLRKLKKMLEATENKINNRIRLFRKVSSQINKNKEKENQIANKKGSIRSHPFFTGKINRNSKCQQSMVSGPPLDPTADIKKRKASMDNPQLALFEERCAKAKGLKQMKSKNKCTLIETAELIEQMKSREMRKKMQSADLIRRNRERVKEIKQECQDERIEEAKKSKQDKFMEEIHKYDELHHKLTQLQREEREALLEWKKTIEQ